MRDTARAPQPPTNPTTGHQMSQQGPWPKMNQNANFGPNLVVFGQKILMFTKEIKSFVTQIMENPPRHLVGIGFRSPWDEMGKKLEV